VLESMLGEASIDRDDEGEFDWCTVKVAFAGPKQ
jgi:hypothetical protein